MAATTPETSSRRPHEPRSRQLGVTERPPEHLLLVAVEFGASDSNDYHAALERLRSVIQAEVSGQPAEEGVETGEIGYEPHHATHSLTVTVGLSVSGYDKLEVPAERRPRDLVAITADVVDSTGQSRGAQVPGQGDLLLKVCSDDVFIVEHVHRRIEHELADCFRIIWAQPGIQRFGSRQAANPRHEARALIGFLDGTSNLNPGSADDRRLIFTDHNRTDYPALETSDQYGGGAQFPPDLRQPPTEPEPAVLDGGTYMAVQVLLQRTGAFDQLAVAEQERVVGRQKRTGGALPAPDVASHVLKSNPGRDQDLARRVLRRGYSVIFPRGDQLLRGLAFIAFGRTLSTQVEFVQRAWMNNPNFPHPGAGPDLLMSQYVEPQMLCGGYYFVPPLARPGKQWSWVI